MNENDIIKALECCIDQMNCRKCPLYVPGDGDCVDIVKFRSLAIINRQKAEIERLEEEVDDVAYRLGGLLCHTTGGKLSKSNYTEETMICATNDYIQECCEEAETEAIKEFAERLKKEMSFGRYIQFDQIDNLVKEMVGERE